MAKDSQETGKYWNKSWNIAYGCTPVGAGCKNCWAKALHNRRRQAGLNAGDGSLPEVYAQGFQYVRVFPERLDIPLHWQKPRIVAVNFSGDPYHKAIPDEMLDRLFAVMALCRQHTFILLSKRGERRAEYLQDVTTNFDIALEVQKIDSSIMPDGPHVSVDLNDLNIPWPLKNVWQGDSVSTQAELIAAWPHLRDTPAAVRILSLEPMIEELDLSYEAMFITCDECGGTGEITDPNHWMHPNNTRDGEGENWCLDCTGDPPKMIAGIDGVIVGCEAGPNRRPCKIEHIESVVAQGQATGVPVWVKGVEINGRVSHKMAEWPKSIQCRELPK